MADRAYFNLRGLVRRVGTTRKRGNGSSLVEEHNFDREGQLVEVRVTQTDGATWHHEVRRDGEGRILEPGRRFERDAAGILFAVDAIEHVGAWSMSALHGVGFGTLGASVARTRFDEREAPVETLFDDVLGRSVCVITYQVNARGLITEAVQRWTNDLAAIVSAAVGSGGGSSEKGRYADGRGQDSTLFATRFQYDDQDRVTEIEAIAGSQRIRSVKTYTPQGDLSTAAEDDGLPTTYEYERDVQGNWIRRLSHHSLTPNQTRWAKSVERDTSSQAAISVFIASILS